SWRSPFDGAIHALAKPTGFRTREGRSLAKLDAGMGSTLAIDAGFLGYVLSGLVSLMALPARLEIALAPLAPVDERNRVLAFPCFAGPDQAKATTLAASVITKKDPQPYARRHGGIRVLSNPFW